MKGSNWISFSLRDCSNIEDSHLPTLSDAEEYLEVHVDETYEGKDASGQGWVPDQGESVPQV